MEPIVAGANLLRITGDALKVFLMVSFDDSSTAPLKHPSTMRAEHPLHIPLGPFSCNTLRSTWMLLTAGLFWLSALIFSRTTEDFQTSQAIAVYIEQ